MKYFGTVKSFDTQQNLGSIKPETGGDELSFDRKAFSWDGETPPTVGQRLSYDVGTNNERKPCAVNLQTI
jgi:cold shock CspA family protein